MNPFQRQSVRLSLFCLALAIFVGCQPGDSSVEEAEQAIEEPKVSSVPLQILVASSVKDDSLITRRWQADSDQPIQFQEISMEDLLGKDVPSSDVILFPSRHLLDLIQSGTIYKLSDKAFESGGEEAVAIQLSAVERSQVRYRGQNFAMPLGCTLPVVITNDAFTSDLKEPVTWDEVLSGIESNATINGAGDLDVNEDALVDRFLFIAGALTDRNSKYGLLFEMQSMKPRLAENEFIEAAAVLQQLSKQENGLVSVVGSHSDAWLWATQGEEPRVAVAVPSLLSKEAEEVASGKVAQVKSPRGSAGWNTGAGLVAAISSRCRQSEQSIEFIKWIRNSGTRAAVSPLIVGVETDASALNSEQLSARARQQQVDSLTQFGLTKEPSLPKTREYRAALAKELLAVVVDGKDSAEAMQSALEEWKTISDSQEGDLRAEYEQSLGLDH